MTTTLPNKPSALIRLAVSDLDKCERDPRYRISMDTGWHLPEEDGVCEVCLAGSVMAQTLGLDPATMWEPDDYCGSAIEQTLQALNSFRLGRWNEGLKHLGHAAVLVPEGLDALVPMPSYKASSDAFKTQMLRAADIFEEAGL